MAHPNYTFVAQRAKHRCEYCHAPEIIFNVAFEVDHIIPISKKGKNEQENLALCCRICNRHKLDRIEGIDHNTEDVFRLFNPRMDRWEEHFFLNDRSFEIEGKTPIGRVTVQILAINSTLQIRARKIWHNLGIFP